MVGTPLVCWNTKSQSFWSLTRKPFLNVYEMFKYKYYNKTNPSQVSWSKIARSKEISQQKKSRHINKPIKCKSIKKSHKNCQLQTICQVSKSQRVKNKHEPAEISFLLRVAFLMQNQQKTVCKKWNSVRTHNIILHNFPHFSTQFLRSSSSSVGENFRNVLVYYTFWHFACFFCISTV